MPKDIHRVIMLDADLKFKADIKELYDRFDLFTEDNILGIGRDLQPVYRHTFWQYRNENPGNNSILNVLFTLSRFKKRKRFLLGTHLAKATSPSLSLHVK